jgi:hypothetical protein
MLSDKLCCNCAVIVVETHVAENFRSIVLFDETILEDVLVTRVILSLSTCDMIMVS